MTQAVSTRLERLGLWLRGHQRLIRGLQWGVVGVYSLLVALPAFLPLPPRTAHLWDNLTLAAQFVFWGIWWPFVLLSMVLFGRVWCGLFCPEGSLSEKISRHGRGGAVPRWVRWGGWPFVAFVATTVYGQMLSVYQYPKPVLLILGGSTGAAVVAGYLWGRDKRVWCRYLCPVSGVFGLLAKLAPLHYRVDATLWYESQARREPVAPVVCAPLVPIRTMQGASRCHMCGRCQGMRGAVGLSLRSPNAEILQGVEPDRWQTALILFGLMGVAFAAFDWATSPVFVAIKQAIAEALVDHGILWPLTAHAPWWLLTDYIDRHDVLTLLDGGVLLGFIALTAGLIGGLLLAAMAVATRALGGWSWRRLHHLTQCCIPLAGCGVFLGLSALTVSLLRSEGLALAWVGPLRVALLGGAAGWSGWLAWGVSGRYARAPLRRIGATLSVLCGLAVAVAGWVQLFWG